MSPRRNASHLINVLGYTFPRLHEGKEWYIDFYSIDPSTGEPRRKKFYIPAMKNKRERRAFADALIERTASKLRIGWNPWVLNENIRSSTPFDEVLDKYLSNLSRSYRKSSVNNYTSRAKILRDYISTLSAPPMYAWHYDRAFVNDFLDWILTDRKGSARTRNNYRGWCSALGEWMVERNYLSENPVTKIRKIQEPKKARQPLTPQMLHELFLHLRRNDRHFLLACMMEYYTFIRPHELRFVRIGDISVKDMTVFIAGHVSKNKMDGKVSLNEDTVSLMLELHVLEQPSHYYLFGPELSPSCIQAPDDIFNKTWATLRKRLQWPEDIKFYSLKDSGIRDLSESKGVVTARDQARHQDIATTNKYLQGRDLSAPEGAKHFKGSLS